MEILIVVVLYIVAGLITGTIVAHIQDVTPESMTDHDVAGLSICMLFWPILAVIYFIYKGLILGPSKLVVWISFKLTRRSK